MNHPPADAPPGRQAAGRRSMSPADQQIAAACCPATTSHGPLRSAITARTGSYFTFAFRHLSARRTRRGCGWHGARTIGQRADAQALNQLNTLTLFWRINMKIENLSKDLDTEAMTEVKGGTALTGQVVPTSLESNELLQNFDITSKAPV